MIWISTYSTVGDLVSDSVLRKWIFWWYKLDLIFAEDVNNMISDYFRDICSPEFQEHYVIIGSWQWFGVSNANALHAW